MPTNITLNQISYDILELYRAAIKDVYDIDIRQIKFWVQNTRAKLLKQKFDKPFPLIDNHYVQDLGAVEVERIDANIILPTGEKYLMRTKIQIPSTIERNGYPGTFTRIGSVDRLNETFNIMSYEDALYSGNGKFNRDFISAFQLGEYVYIISKNPIYQSIKYINIRGVFQNPTLAALIANPTYTDDMDYPVNASLVDDMKALILSKEYKLILTPNSQGLNDEVNNLDIATSK